MAELRRPSYNNNNNNNHLQQTPRIGGCTGAFFNLFDWNNSKRFASTKRLPAERLDKPLGRSKSFRDDRSRGCVSERGVSKISEDDAGSRAPVGLVARLMGLESLPEATPRSSKHRRSQSESVSLDSRPIERLALRDMLKQEHEGAFETTSGWNDEIRVVPTVEKRTTVRSKGDTVHTPIKSSRALVPYEDSVYALPYVRDNKGENLSPFLARLHPSPVPLQPSKCHNQMVTTTATTLKKRASSRFLEAAVKILEEISDKEQGMREFAASSPGSDRLHCRSMSKIEGAESVGSRSSRSLMSRGSVSFQDSYRRDRICRDIFETERAQSVSPPPRRPKAGRRILRTQEAAVGDFKIDVRKYCNRSEAINSKSSVQRATPVRERIKSLHFQATRISNGLEDHDDAVTSDEESPRALTRKFKTLGEDRSSLRKGAMSSASPAADFRVTRNARERIIQCHEDAIVPSPQLRTRTASGSLHDGSCTNRHENALPVSSNRMLSTERAESRSAASSPNHSRRVSGQKDDLKLAVRSKKDAPSKQGRPATELPARSPLPSAAPLKRTRRKGRHGPSPKLRESSSGPSRSVVRRTPPRPNLHENHSHNLEAKKSTRIPTGGKDSERSLCNVFPDIDPRDAGNNDSVEMIDANSDCRDETGEALQKVEQMRGPPARDLLPSPETAQCNEVLILGMEDLHWDEQQRQNSSHARYCEVRASGESLQSMCGALDEDVCNQSSPSPQKFAGECSEADVHDESSSPVLMKRFLGKPLRLDADMGEASPVSVLESPFGDELCTTSESSITESEHRAASALEQTETTNFTEAVAECGIDEEEVSTPTPLDRIRQAILDLSSFTNRDQACESNHGSPQTEKTFVREVLSAAQLLCSPGRSPNWHERDLAVDPALFERLEGGETSSNGDFRCESGGMWRCDRKLLFDCVNEAFSQNAKEPQQPWLRRPVVRQRLVEEVQEKINGWRELASHAIDTLIDIDMSSRAGKWTDFREEVSDIGAEIEGMVWQVIVEEVVLDLAGSLLF